MTTRHARNVAAGTLVVRSPDHDADTCLLCAGERLAALVRRALDKPGSVAGRDFRPALEAFERLATE